MAYRVLIADDQKMVRMLLETILNDSEQYTLVSSCAGVRDVPVLCREEHIDLALLDVLFPDGKSGIDATREIKVANPRTKVVIMTSMPEVSYLRQARSAGVDSFWYKEIQELPILTLLERTMAGESIYPDATPELSVGSAMSAEFTERELDVLREILQGYTNAEIGQRLHMGERTVKQHITHMLEKTGYPNRVVLAVQARALGIVIND